ncbi:MAG: IclR family transcriptional regulator C-terminal domain-containing protein, partial [Ruthenibacterium sp.]
QKLTPHTLTDFDSLINQLKEIRLRGYAIDDEENELGIRCVALSLPALTGRAEAAFSISGLAPHMNPVRVAELAQTGLDAKQAILRDLGWK